MIVRPLAYSLLCKVSIRTLLQDDLLFLSYFFFVKPKQRTVTLAYIIWLRETKFGVRICAKAFRRVDSTFYTPGYSFTTSKQALPTKTSTIPSKFHNKIQHLHQRMSLGSLCICIYDVLSKLFCNFDIICAVFLS